MQASNQGQQAESLNCSKDETGATLMLRAPSIRLEDNAQLSSSHIGVCTDEMYVYGTITAAGTGGSGNAECPYQLPYMYQWTLIGITWLPSEGEVPWMMTTSRYACRKKLDGGPLCPLNSCRDFKCEIW